MTPKAVVFDLGKVLLDFDYRITVKRIAAHCDRSPGQILQAVDQSSLLHRYESGLMNTAVFYGEVCELIGYRGKKEDFCHAFGDIFSAIPPMVEWHGRLRAAGIPTFILSNTNALAVDHIRPRFPFFAEFDGHVFSYEHRSMKPDARLYEVVEEMSGHTGNALFYLDDRPENVEAARARGWQSVHHVSVEASLGVARKAGLPG